MRIPSDCFVRTESGVYFTTEAGRFRIISSRILKSWSPQRIIKATEQQLKDRPVKSNLKFRNGSLIHNISDGKVYLIVGGKRCLMASPEAYDLLGIKRSRKNIMSVSLNEILMHEEGEHIT